MKIILETKRTYLREVTDDDFNALSKVISNKDGTQYDEEYVWRWLNWCKSSYKEHNFGLYAVILKETGEMIGNMGISMQMIDDEWRPEIGYHLRKDYHHQGIAKEVTNALQDYFFTNFDYDEVYSYMDEDNIASSKTAEAMGMTYLHLYKTKHGVCKVYKITKEEWKNKNNGR